MKVLVTGPSGFLGRNLVQWLRARNYSVIEFDRSNPDYSNQLSGTEAVVHCAALVHSFENIPYKEYQASNVILSLKVAEAAIEAGVSKFIFISTIKVFGEEREIPISEESQLRPQDDYSKSKLEAEQELKKLFSKSSAQLIILRPPLIYGPGVKANLKALIDLVKTSIPLPFKFITNRRSLIFVKNFSDLIEKIISTNHHESFELNVSDCTLSLYELTSSLKEVLASKTIIFSVPNILLKLIFFMSGQTKKYPRLYGSLSIDNSKLKSKLNWNRPFSLKEALIQTVQEDKAIG